MKTPRSNLDFSIVIPVLNEEKDLPHLLDDLSKQTFRSNQFEVLVVDGKSNDNTVALAQGFADILQLSVIQASKSNVSSQRNLGTKQAKANWIIFMDADIRIPPSFLDGIKYQLAKDQRVDCFTCWIDETSYKTIDKPLITMFNLSLEVFAKIRPGALGALIGSRRSLAQKNPFDHTLGLSEDYEFIHQLVKKNNTFTTLHYPKYHLSLRRLEREGTLKLARTYAKAQLYFLMGRKIKHGEIDYPMGGNVSKTKSKWSRTTIEQIKSNFSDLVVNHNKTATKILDWLNQNQF